MIRRIHHFFNDLKEGIRWGYPLCCFLHFALDDLLIGKRRQAVRRGGFSEIREDGSPKEWVACFMCMGKEGWSKYPETEEEMAAWLGHSSR